MEAGLTIAEESLIEVMVKLGMTKGFDVGLEMSGSAPAMRDMIETMNNGGKIALLGIAPTEFGFGKQVCQQD